MMVVRCGACIRGGERIGYGNSTIQFTPESDKRMQRLDNRSIVRESLKGIMRSNCVGTKVSLRLDRVEGVNARPNKCFYHRRFLPAARVRQQGLVRWLGME